MCVLIVVMFLGIIGFGLAPAHPHAPEEENKLFGCYHKHLLLLLYKRIKARVFMPWFFAKKVGDIGSCQIGLGKEASFVCRMSGGDTMAVHIVPTLHQQNAATKMFKWNMD